MKFKSSCRVYQLLQAGIPYDVHRPQNDILWIIETGWQIYHHQLPIVWCVVTTSEFSPPLHGQLRCVHLAAHQRFAVRIVAQCYYTFPPSHRCQPNASKFPRLHTFPRNWNWIFHTLSNIFHGQPAVPVPMQLPGA